MAADFGRVPLPAIEIRDIPSSDNTAWDDLGPRTVRAICWHRAQGSLAGTDTFFRQTADAQNTGYGALSDYGVGVAAQDGDDLAGVIYRWNDPQGNRSPHANGPVSSPYGDGKALVDRFGIEAVNRDCTSLEISGFLPAPDEGVTEDTPLDDRSRQAIAHLTAYWADQYQVSHETFPLIPGEGNRSFVIWHEEFTVGTSKSGCPGPVVKDETDALIARAKGILKKHQTDGNGGDPRP